MFLLGVCVTRAHWLYESKTDGADSRYICILFISKHIPKGHSRSFGEVFSTFVTAVDLVPQSGIWWRVECEVLIVCVCVHCIHSHTHIHTKRLTINNQRKISKGEARRHKHMCSYRDFGLGIECVVRRTTSHIHYTSMCLFYVRPRVCIWWACYIYICCDDVRDMLKYNIEK